jgi:hypothetical protein
MDKAIGYVVAIGGIVVMAFGLGMIPLEVAFLEGVAGNVVSGVGVGMVVVGVLLSMNKGGGKKGKGDDGEDEVPIYEGVGKKRRIVGYRKS